MALLRKLPLSVLILSLLLVPASLATVASEESLEEECETLENGTLVCSDPSDPSGTEEALSGSDEDASISLGDEDAACKPHPDILDAFLCHLPEVCDGTVNETRECTQLDACEQLEDGLLLCRAQADEARAEKRRPAHAPRCAFTGDPNSVTCEPPAVCDRSNHTAALCEPPAHCIAGPDGTYTCELPRDRRLDPAVIEEAMRELERDGPVGPCGLEACDFDDRALEDEARIKEATKAAHALLAETVQALQPHLAELRLEWQGGIEELRAQYHRGKADLRAEYYVCREDGGSVADCGTEARAELDALKQDLIAERDALRASLIAEAEQAKDRVCDELSHELESLRGQFGLTGVPARAFAPSDALRLCHDGGA